MSSSSKYKGSMLKALCFVLKVENVVMRNIT